MLTGMFGWRMTFNFFRLVVLFTTPALRRAGAGAAMAPLLAPLLALLLLLPAGAAQAAQDHFNGGNVADCTLVGATYTCATLSQANDITIASGYTVEVSGSVSFTWFQVLKLSGSAVLRAGADLDLRCLQTGNTQVAGGTLAAGGAFRLGSNDQTVTANVVAASVATGGPSTRINGNVTASGLVDLGSNSTVTGAVNAGSVKTSANITLGGSVTASGAVDLGSNTTITGTLSAATVTSNSNVQVNGGITASGTVSLGPNNIVKGGITGITGVNNGIAGAVTTGSGSTITGDIVASAFTLASGGSLTGNITAPQVQLSAANVVVKGSITASTSLVVGSGASVTGNIDSPKVDLNASGVTIKGDIKASSSLTISSGNTVNGNISGTTLTIASSNVIVNGNVTMKGDVDIGSGATINGDLSARNVTTHSSGDTINGNAAVNAIFLDWGATVSKTITCTGPGAVLCSCVTKADPNYKPMCAAAPPSGVHHFRITHPGYALTCQPQPVTVTACANNDCTLPNYSGTATAVLQPGGKSFTFIDGETTATVEQLVAGPATVSASGGLNPSSCVNTGDPQHPCDLIFATSGLVVKASNHVSMAGGATVTIQALTASAKNQNCVPLVTGKTVDVNLVCEYSDPSSKTAAVTPVVGGKTLNCGAGATKVGVPFGFDGNGVASVPLEYAEVGKVKLTASYTGAGFNAAGSGEFIAAPYAFVIDAYSKVSGKTLSKLDLAKEEVFAKASEAFTVTVTAVNAKLNRTRNFGKESSQDNIVLSAAIANPDQANQADRRDNGAIAAGKFAPFSDGATQSLTDASGLWSFSDVGTISLDAKLTNNTGPNTANYYMGYVGDGFRTVGTQKVTRFIPDHFDTVLMAAAEIAAPPASRADARVMSCANLASANRPCPTAAGSFINSNQPFFVKVLAYNGAQPPALTTNYTGPLARPVTLSAVKAPGVTGSATEVSMPGATLAWTGAATDTAFTFSQGVGTPANPVANLPLLRLAGAYPAANVVPVPGYLRALDSETVSSLRSDTPAASVEAELTVVSGRLLIANTYGPPNGSVPVNATAEYYMPGGYVFNPQVQVTSQPIGGFVKYGNCLKGYAAACPTMKAATPSDPLVLTNGKGMFRLAPPNPAPTSISTVDVSLGLLINYLPSAVGRATFGIYRSGPVIYRREVY